MAGFVADGFVMLGVVFSLLLPGRRQLAEDAAERASVASQIEAAP